MSCTKCSSSSTINGNCGCIEVIEVVVTGATGPRGLTGPAGASVLYNDHVDAADIDNLNPQTLKSFTLDNTPTPVMNVNGDLITVEAQFSVIGGISTTLSLLTFTTTVASLSVVTTIPRTYKLRAVINRTTGVAAQAYDYESIEYGLPDSRVSTAESSATVDHSIDVAVIAQSHKTVKIGAGDVTCNYLRIEKHAKTT